MNHHVSAMPRIHKPRPWVLILFGLFMLWGFGWETIGRLLLTQVEGVIVESRDIPPDRSPRYITEYTVRGPNGDEQVFRAGRTDASLPRSMPVGTRILKQQWHLDFERDGQLVEFSGRLFYAATLTCAFGAVIWGCLVLRSAR
jgi:hypothetical protein